MVILMYHRVSDNLPRTISSRAPKPSDQMRFLCRHPNVCQVISLKEFETGHPAIFGQDPKTKVIITFDDGYRDNYLNAFQVLKNSGSRPPSF